MTKKMLVDYLKDIDDNAQVRIAQEGDILEFQIVGVLIEGGEAVLEFRGEDNE